MDYYSKNSSYCLILHTFNRQAVIIYTKYNIVKNIMYIISFETVSPEKLYAKFKTFQRWS